MSSLRLSVISAICLIIVSCSSNPKKAEDTFCAGPAYRDSVLLANKMITYDLAAQGEGFEDAHLAFVADEKQLQKVAQDAKLAFDKSVETMSEKDRKYMKGCYNDFADLAVMAEYAYKDSVIALPKGWKDISGPDSEIGKYISQLKSSGILPTGLKCSLLAKGDRYVLSFAGTDFPADWKNMKQVMNFIIDGYEDVDGALNNDASQIKLASSLISELIKKYNIPQDKLEFIGHSLGGRIASEMAVEYGCPAVVFNAAGVSPDVYKAYESLKAAPTSDRSGYIINITSVNDPLTSAQKYMSGSSDPYISSLAGLVSDDKDIQSIITSVGKTALSFAASFVSEKSEVVGSLLGVAEKYYDRDYKAIGARLIVTEDVEGHGIRPLSEALRNRADSI